MKMLGWVSQVRRWARLGSRSSEPVIGVALGGGFARGMAHIGVLRALEEHNVPVAMVAGVSAGAIVASAYASGSGLDHIARLGRTMKFTDIASWTVSAMGLAASQRMEAFLRKLLRVYRFEEMQLPLAVVATDLRSGRPVVFRGHGDVFLPVRASCAYPGLFQPLHYRDQLLVDGAMSMEIPALALRKMGATHVISVSLPVNGERFDPRNMFHVLNRCFQIMHTRTERDWRRYSSAVIEPDVTGMSWDCFDSCEKLIECGERAALPVIPRILNWLEPRSGQDRTRPYLGAGDPRPAVIP